jgi:hypothetical protein
MTSGEISNARLRSQKVEATEFNTAREIVSWMGAVQAQDYSIPKLKSSTKSRHNQLGLTESVISKSEGILEIVMMQGVC